MNMMWVSCANGGKQCARIALNRTNVRFEGLDFKGVAYKSVIEIVCL